MEVRGVLARLDTNLERSGELTGRDCVVSPEATLLYMTHEMTTGTVRLEKLEYAMPNAGHNLNLVAPVSSGSRGAELFDKTQRDRKMFERGKTGGSSTHESYCSQLFAGAANPEIHDFVARSLEG